MWVTMKIDLRRLRLVFQKQRAVTALATKKKFNSNESHLYISVDRILLSFALSSPLPFLFVLDRENVLYSNDCVYVCRACLCLFMREMRKIENKHRQSDTCFSLIFEFILSLSFFCPPHSPHSPLLLEFGEANRLQSQSVRMATVEFNCI